MPGSTPTRQVDPNRGGKSTPHDTALPAITPQSNKSNENSNSKSPTGSSPQPRRSSFSFLRSSSRSASRGKMSKKKRAVAEEELRRQQDAALPKQPPQLPSPPPLPQIKTFGGENARPDSYGVVANKATGFNMQSIDFQAHNIPIPPIPGPHSDFVDPYARTESMTNRGRYSYASSAVSTINSPRRVRRRRDPTPFNILVIGAKGSGKTSFIQFLRSALAKPRKKRAETPSPSRGGTYTDSAFTSDYLETEIDHERIGVTLWDSHGLERHVVDLQLREMSAFLESKFEDTFTEEQRVIRSPGVRDTHIHCVFLILDPSRLNAKISATRKTGGQVSKRHAMHPGSLAGLDEDLDLQVLRTLQGKTTVIPVISKADTITTAHMNFLKRTVWENLRQAKLDPLEVLNLSESDSEDTFDERDEDDVGYPSSEDVRYHSPGDRGNNPAMMDSGRTYLDPGSESEGDLKEMQAPQSQPPDERAGVTSNQRAASAMSQTTAPSDPELPALPLSIISPDEYDPSVVGRRFPWGLADPYNPEHCDFVRLKDSVFSDWRSELREASREQWYEGWRTTRLKRRGTPLRGASSNPGGFKGPQNFSGQLMPNGRTMQSNGTMASRALSAGSAHRASPESPRQLYRGVGSYQ